MTLEHKNHFRRRRAAAEEMARVTPGSKGARFFAHAYAKYEQEAIDEEIVLNHAKAGELLDLRFIGPQAQSGSLPLHQFFDILKPLDSGLNAAAYRLRYGKESRRIDENTRDTMGLRLAGTGRGSMRVLVVGDGRFDTTGVNVLQSTLTQTFRLLTASNTEFFDAVDAVGGKAARYLGSALHMTVRHGLATEFSWQRSDQSTLRWDGAPNEIRRVCALIESTKEPEVYEEVLRGRERGKIFDMFCVCKSKKFYIVT